MTCQSAPPYCLAPPRQRFCDSLTRHTFSSRFTRTPQGVTSWFVFYLIKEKGIEDAAQVGSVDLSTALRPRVVAHMAVPK